LPPPPRPLLASRATSVFGNQRGAAEEAALLLRARRAKLQGGSMRPFSRKDRRVMDEAREKRGGGGAARSEDGYGAGAGAGAGAARNARGAAARGGSRREGGGGARRGAPGRRASRKS